jgi:hypothetical protein
MIDFVKLDQVSIAARAGALDGSLAYASVYLQHQDLIAQTALSGLRGLEQTLSQTGVYGQAVRALEEASDRIDEANIEAFKDPFTSASSGLQSQHTTATTNGLRNQGWPFVNTSQNIKNTVQNAVNGTDATKPERGLANSVYQAIGELELASYYLVNQADPSATRHHATNSLNNATTARNNAQALWNTLNAENPKPTARLNATQNVINAANDVINHSNSVLNFVNNEPIAIIRSHSATTHDLGDGYSLSTWGNSGYMTLTDANGAGVIISPNGTTKDINGGSTSSFSSTTTFVLDNRTKVTINPGAPANVLITRGIHAFTISNVNGNAWPSVGSYTDLNGRDVDRASGDGNIYRPNGSAASWLNQGTASGNELRLDPTDVAISADMQSFITQMGFADYDYDGDGKLNNIELMVIADRTAVMIKQIQDAYEQALAKVALANKALEELNQIIELLRKQADRQGESRSNDNAATKAELQAVERRLVAALQLLQGNTAEPPIQGDIQASATNVLGQLTSITQSGGLVPSLTNTSSTPPPTSTTETPTPNTFTGTSGQPTNGTSTDPLGDSLRRASRLLSGILGGGNLNILELPPKPSETPGTTPPEDTATVVNGETVPVGTPTHLTGEGAPTPGSESPQSQPTGTTQNTPLTSTGATQAPGSTAPQRTGNLLADLLTQLSGLEGSPPTSANASNLSLGLETLLTSLTQLGVFAQLEQNVSAGSSDLLQSLAQLLGSASGEPVTQPPKPSALTSLLGALAQLGAALQPPEGQVPALPQQTTPASSSLLPASVQQLFALLTGQSASSLPPLSATAQQVADILQGQAALGSAGAQQGSGSTGFETGGLAKLSRAVEQLNLVLQGLAELGSAGAGQSTRNGTAQPPTTAELRLGLQSLFAALSTSGLLGSNTAQQPTSTSGNGTGSITFQNNNTQLISSIANNFLTDPELLKIIRENLRQAQQTEQRQLNQASNLFTQSQEIVQKFVALIQEDDLVREVVKSDNLSDEQQALFDNRMTELRKDWGIDWGSSQDNTPTSQSNLVTRAVQSGTMV